MTSSCGKAGKANYSQGITNDMYTRRTVTSRAGLSQEEALLSLQEHPDFAKRGARIGSIRRRGDQWVATILEPKVAEFPPGGGDDEGPDEGSEPKEPKADSAPAGDGDSDDGGPDGGSDGPPGAEGKGGSEKAEVGQLLHLVQQIADALGVVAPDAMAAGPAGPDAMGPGPSGPPAPSPHGGPAPGAGMEPGGHGGGFGGGQPHGTKLKPGEVPNKPGVVPVGSPAFAKVQARQVTASTHDPHSQLKIAGVVADLKRQFPQHTVRQVTRHGEYVRAFLTL